MHYPRHSLLSLFDPLVSPPRDAPSPDSDKENSSPLALFPRPKHHNPVVLTRRLVDVGDLTTDDPSTLAMLTDEHQLEGADDDDDDTQNFVLPATTPTRLILSSPAIARTPLAELPIESDTTPVARTKIYKRPAVFSLPATHPHPSPTPPPIVPILLVTSPPPSTQPVPSPDISTTTPDIVITYSDSPSQSAVQTDNSHQLATISSEVSSSPTSTLRPRPLSSLPHDTNRCSVDLHASFQLHLQSAETSFDLLNDKISFFTAANGMDSFLNAMDEDDSFDIAVEEENLERALERMKLEDKEEQARVRLLNVANPPLKSPRAQGTPSTQPSPLDSPALGHKPAFFSKRSSLGSNPNCPSSSSFVFAEIPDAVTPALPVSNIEPILVSALSTPLAASRSIPVLPKPAVPALRIVKRAMRISQEKSPSSHPLVGPAAASRAERSVPASSSVAATAKQAPPPPSATAFRRGMGLSRVFAAAPLPVTATGTGPRRVPVVESQSKIMHDTTGTQKIPFANSTAPRRVAVAVSGTVPAAQKKPLTTTASGLRMPMKYKAGAASTLPRSGSASRLPAPSVSRVVGSGTQGIAPRRMGYGV